MAKGRKTETPAPANDGVERNDVVDTVRGLAAVVAEHQLSELIVDTDGVTITLRRGAPAVTHVAHAMPGLPAMPALPHAPPPAPVPLAIAPEAGAAAGANGPAAGPVDNAHVVTSPFVGTFYRRPNPDSPMYVQVNEKVDKGQVLCIVEAMKLMNEIEADIAGTVVAVLAEDGSPVEYGQPLFKIMP